jgi:L-threonylcarbamoyladenylate synthase
MTRIIRSDEIDEAVSVLHSGGVLALPTDTVYGVGASLFDERAVARLFALKQRPVNVALPVLIGSLDQLELLAITIEGRIRRLVDELWPGALTLILNADQQLAQRVGSNTSTIGVRYPDDEALRALLRESGPLAVTSANRHGYPPCVSADDVAKEFASSNELDVIVDGGVRNSPVSTVVDVSSDNWIVLREGAVSSERIASVAAKR